MAVTLNAASPKVTTTGTSLNISNFTLAARKNSIILVPINFQAVVTNVVMTWDAAGANQAFTLVHSGVHNANNMKIYALLTPGSEGNKIISITWTTSAFVEAGVVAFDNVLQTSLAEAVTDATTNNATSTTDSITIPSSSGDSSVALTAAGDVLSAPTTTEIFNDTSVIAAYKLSVNTSDVHQWTVATSAPWRIIGVRVNQADRTAPARYSRFPKPAMASPILAGRLL